jgi:hypothetical protein
VNWKAFSVSAVPDFISLMGVDLPFGWCMTVEARWREEVCVSKCDDFNSSSRTMSMNATHSNANIDVNHTLGSTIYYLLYIYFCFFFYLKLSMYREQNRQEIHQSR